MSAELLPPSFGLRDLGEAVPAKKEPHDHVLAERTSRELIRRGATLLLIDPIPKKAKISRDWKATHGLHGNFPGHGQRRTVDQSVTVDWLVHGTKGPELTMLVGFILKRAKVLSEAEEKELRKKVRTYCISRGPDVVGKRLLTKKSGDKLVRAYMAAKLEEEGNRPSNKRFSQSAYLDEDGIRHSGNPSNIPQIRETLISDEFGDALAKKLLTYGPNFSFPPGPQSLERYVALHARKVLEEVRARHEPRPKRPRGRPRKKKRKLERGKKKRK